MFLGDLVRVITENDLHKDKNVASKFDHYLKRNQLEFNTADRRHWESTWRDDSIKIQQSKCFVLGGNPEFKFDYAEIYTSKNATKLNLTKETCALAQ